MRTEINLWSGGQPEALYAERPNCLRDQSLQSYQTESSVVNPKEKMWELLCEAQTNKSELEGRK